MSDQDKFSGVMGANAAAIREGLAYMQSAKPFVPQQKATVEDMLKLLRGWSDSDFANAASGEFCEDLKAKLEGALDRAIDALAFRSAQPGDTEHRSCAPPEPVVNPSAEWLDAYADWYYQGKS